MDHTKSYYAASANPSPARPPLQGTKTCDVAIIGAGFTGLSTGLHLAERGYKVMIVEQARVAYGASGRNGGQLVNGYSRDYDHNKKHYGEATARALLNMSFEGANIIRERIAKYDIACDYKPGGFFAAITPKQIAELEHKKKVWESAGHTALEMKGKDDLPAIVGTDIYCGGLLDNWGGHIHPMNLCLGQAAAIESLGGEIFEQTPATRIEKGAKPAVVTPQGRIEAKIVVVCGNAYLSEDVSPELAPRYMPVSSQIITTEPLGRDLARRVLPSDYCVEDCNYVLDYYRITGDDRLLFGGGIVYGGAEPADIRARLHPRLLKTFSFLEGKKIDFAWSGTFALTLTRMPHVGRLSDTVYFSHGDSGHGVTTTHLLGRILSEAISGQMERFDVFAGMRNFPFPGGRLFRVPLTALGAWYYGLRDRLGI